jgi:hypothetical protein
MRIIDDKLCAVATAEFDNADERRKPTIHAEHAVGDDKALSRASCCLQQFGEVRCVPTAIGLDACPAETPGIDRARVVVGIREDKVAITDQARQNGSIRGSTRGRQHDRLDTEETRELILQSAMFIADCENRIDRRPGPVGFERRRDRLCDLRVG